MSLAAYYDHDCNYIYVRMSVARVTLNTYIHDLTRTTNSSNTCCRVHLLVRRNAVGSASQKFWEAEPLMSSGFLVKQVI